MKAGMAWKLLVLFAGMAWVAEKSTYISIAYTHT
jgi:hypothetical protein